MLLQEKSIRKKGKKAVLFMKHLSKKKKRKRKTEQ